MAKEKGVRFSEHVQELFSSGSVMLFTCEATDTFATLFLSDNVEKIVGFKPSYFLKDGRAWSARIHPDDKDRVYQRFQEAVKAGGGVISEYRFKTKSGSYIWLRDEIKLIDDEHGGGKIYGTCIDITDQKEAEISLKENNTVQLKQEIEGRKQAENKLQRRLSYEQAISKCSSLLLENSSTEALRESLNILQQATESDRVYLYKNVEEEGQLFLEPVMEVMSEEVNPAIVNTGKKTAYEKVPWWYKHLSSGKTIKAHRHEVPEPERSILERQSVKSVLVIPIKVNGEWYGYVGFADTKRKRNWDDNEVSMLQTAAGIIGAFQKRKKIEKTLIQQRNYTETILNSLPSIYILMDEDFQFVQWNENAERFSGYSPKELGHMAATDIIVERDHEELKEATQRLRDNEGDGSELHLLTKDGREIPYFWHGYFIELNQRKFFLCVGIDITQQKQVEKELLDEKRFNEALIESLPGNFYMVDKEGKFTRWNKNFEESMGYSSKEMQEITAADLFEDEEFEKVAREIKQVFVTGESEIETVCITKDGEKIPYFLSGKSFARDGEQHLVGVGHDISEQVHAREKLKKSEELFRNLFLKAPAAIVMLAPDNSVHKVNKSFEKLFGYSQEEICGKDIDEMIVPETEKGKAPSMQTQTDPSDNFHAEAKRLTKAGELVDVFIAAFPVFVNERPVAGFGMYIDISEQKKYEQEIYDSLQQKQLLLKEIHHRVKNNLAVVSGLLQLQMYETENPTVRDTLKESENRIQTMALIHEKLYNSENLSRISCDSYISDLVETIRNTSRTEQKISVETNIDDVKLDINKAVPFALLVNEMVTNSFKHAFDDQEEGTINIDLQKKGEELDVEIRDNGKGLPDDFAGANSDSLGMKLINSFAQQLGADWEIGSKDGAYIKLVFPISEVGDDSSTVRTLE